MYQVSDQIKALKFDRLPDEEYNHPSEKIKFTLLDNSKPNTKKTFDMKQALARKITTEINTQINSGASNIIDQQEQSHGQASDYKRFI